MTPISRRTLLRSTGIAGAGVAAMAAAPATTSPLSGDLVTDVTSTGARAVGDAVDALRLAKVFPTTDAARRLLAELDDTHVRYGDGGVEVLLWPGDLARITAAGVRVELLETPEERHVAVSRENRMTIRNARRAPGETDTGDYRTLPDFEADMRMLAETYPDKARLIELPYRTLDRRTVYGLEVCDRVEREDGRPVFYNDGCHHAREWPAAEVPLMWAYDLLEADQLADDDPSKQRLLTIRRKVRNIVVPVVNPDGYDWSRSFPIGTGGADLGTGEVGTFFGDGVEAIPGRGRYWRKNRRQYLGSDVGVANPTTLQPDQFTPQTAGAPDGNPLPDQYGIDPNRNYAFGWGGDGSSSITDSQTYRGSQPFSEQEARNVQWVFEKYMCTAAISHHTSGDLVLWAWGDTSDDAPDNALLEGIGRAMAEYNGYVPQKSIDLYVTTGTASDYMYGSRASISYTFEHAGTAFHPEYTATVPAMYEANRDAMMFLCEQACLRPGARPDYSDPAVLSEAAATRMADLGVGLYDLNHCVLKGTMGTRGTITVTKSYDVQLWVQDYENGSTGAENPLGQPDFPERQECTFRTRADGRFELHLNPSTQPKVEFLGRTETYDISFIPDDPALQGAAMRRVVTRTGRVENLGNVLRGRR